MKIVSTFLLLSAILPLQGQQAELEKERKVLQARTIFVNDSVSKLMRSCNAQIKLAPDVKKREYLRLRLDSLYNVSDRNDIDALQIDFAFAKKHPESMYALELVKEQITRQSGKNFYDDFESVYNHSADEVKQSESGRKMAEQLRYFKQSKVGSMAPDFQGLDLDGKPISLSDFKGQYILIDFWASWCGPCREELPYIKELYAKYKAIGFEIISISRDEDLAKWKNAIAKEAIGNWKHFSSASNKTSVEKDYFVAGIPHKILIDKNGTIIGKWKGSGELNRKSLENQLAEIFK